MLEVPIFLSQVFMIMVASLPWTLLIIGMTILIVKAVKKLFRTIFA